MKHVRAFLDNSMEIAIALARLLAMLGTVATILVGFAAIWSPPGDGERMIGTLILAALLTLALGFAGFYTFGNEEWRRGKTDDRGASVRND